MKTEFLIAGTFRQHVKVLFYSLSVSGTIIPASPCVKNLHVIIDEELTLNIHITYICKSCYHNLGNIHTVWLYLRTSSAKPLCIQLSLQNWITATLSLSTSQIFITKLRVQNAAVGFVLNLKKYDSVTPYLMKLHWLPIIQRIIYKRNLIVFKALKYDAPTTFNPCFQ